MWATPNFKNPARNMRETLAPEDDFYALGMVLACAVTAVSYFSLDPSALPRSLDEFVRHGIPPAVRKVITALVAGDVAAARDTLGQWRARTMEVAIPATPWAKGKPPIRVDVTWRWRNLE
ncbi:hypothetical protein [Streptomyces scabiei]|uniref:hypothetical protein n=1 Tax=Streptomyces scabiei TaxID=1930 RepID=UPI0029A94973|nr:hypothetical protein [Streptomyces scabiei]MDX3116007.1 hypothetical protein [Streptomyces scabiei]